MSKDVTVTVAVVPMSVSVVFEPMSYFLTYSSRQLFIGNLCNVSVDALRTYCEQYGQLIEVSLNRDKDNNIFHCFAFVTFKAARYATQFMSKRPHSINGEQVFVKRALSRFTASIPERLVVTNRLVLADATKYDADGLRSYFEKLGPIKNFDYEKGLIDFQDYDDVDRILMARPHFIKGKEISVTKYIPTEQSSTQIINEPSDGARFYDNDEDLKVQLKHLKRQFEEYKQTKDAELNMLKQELQRAREELSDVTQIKLDKLIKNQQLFQQQLLTCLNSNTDSAQASLCGDFIQSTSYKRRKATMGSPSNDGRY